MTDEKTSNEEELSSVTGLETTATQIARIAEGDEAEQERLMSRLLPELRRFAHGRVPRQVRDLADTDDIVQITVVKALEKVRDFEPQRKGSFLAYLRRTLQNKIYDLLRSSKYRRTSEITHEPEAPEASPLEEAAASERFEAYRQALAQLEPHARTAVIMRVERECSNEEIGRAIDRSPDAARMVVSRALARLAKLMGLD